MLNIGIEVFFYVVFHLRIFRDQPKASLNAR